MSLIVVEGAIGAGKTSLATKLNNWDEDTVSWNEPEFEIVKLGEKSFHLLEINYKTPLRRDEIVGTQLIICDILKEYYETAERKKNIIMDRWIPSCLRFSTMFREMDLLTDFSYEYVKHHTEKAQASFLKNLNGREIYKMYIDTPIEECLDNIVKRGRPAEIMLPREEMRKRLEKFRNSALENNSYHTVGRQEEIEAAIKKIITGGKKLRPLLRPRAQKERL